MKPVTILLFGCKDSGKTALGLQYSRHYFLEDSFYTIEDEYRRQDIVDGTQVILKIQDVLGYEGEELHKSYYFKQCDGFIFCYRINRRDQFEQLEEIRKCVLSYRQNNVFPLVLVGTWCDDESRREVTRDEGENLARSWGCPFFEASAKTRVNCDEVFHQVVREIWEKNTDANNNEDPEEEKKDKCCIM